MNNRKFKKAFSLMVSLILVLVIVAGCAKSGGSTASDAPSASPASTPASSTAATETAAPAKTLTGSIEVGTLAAEGTAEYNFDKSITDSIAAKNPGTKLDLLFVNTLARPKIDQRWRAGNPPDIDWQVFNSQLPSTLAFAPNLLDLTPYMNEKAPGQDIAWKDTFLPGNLPQMTLDGKILAVPAANSPFVLFYNKKMFDDLKISPPKTYEEFLAVCEALKKNNVDPIAVSGLINFYMEMWPDYFFQREAGYDETVKAIRGGGFKDNPAFLTAAKKVQELRDKKYFMKGFEGTDFTPTQLAFFQGKTGMILMGSWLVSEMKDSVPADFQVGVTSFPTISGGKGDQNALFGAPFMMSVAKSSKSPELAVAYLQQFTSLETATNAASTLQSISPMKGVPVSDKMFGLKDVVENGINVYRYLGIEKDTDLWNAYGVEVSKLFFGKYATAEQFIDGLDAMAKKMKK